MLFKPRWVKLIPSYLRPDEKRIRELENLRVTSNIPHEALAMRVMSSPTTTQKVESMNLMALRVQNSQAPEKELLKILLVSRIQKPPEIEMTEQEIDNAMKNINSFDDLCDYIAALEEEHSFPDPLGLGKKIDETLAQQEVDEKAPAENIIKLLEQTYFNLRKDNPNRDEHWLLANTWLNSYGSTKQAKQKGVEWAKFVAYKDTLQFSILEPPKSIRALALFLVYKELGEATAFYYSSEFSQLMRQIIESQESNVFLQKYKKRNPRTWKENQVEEGASHWSRMLYWLLRGLEPSKEAEEAWNQSEIKREIERGECKGFKDWRY